MGEIQFAIEGKDAAEAAKSLLDIPEISGDWEPVGGTQKSLSLATFATIVAITGGSLAIAEQIRTWYKEWKKGRSGKTIEKAVIICSDGKRLLMKDAAVEDIQRFLESC